MQLPEVSGRGEEKKKERGRDGNEIDRRTRLFLTWLKTNGQQFVALALVHKSLKIVIAIYHRPAGVILFSPDGTSNEIRRYFPLGAIYQR